MDQNQNILNSSLILEGGGSRGLFTAGAVDCLIKKNIDFKYVIGVSAGSCNALDYVAKQAGRTKECFIPEKREDRYVGLGNIFKYKSVYDMSKLFGEYPMKTHKFDFDTYFASETECEMVVSNCETGKAEYLSEKTDKKKLMDICCASCSMPFVANMVWIDGTPYMDGGLADSIPLIHTLKKGYKKNVLILTRNKGYRKEEKDRFYNLYAKVYKNYEHAVKMMQYRNYHYNRTLEYVEKLENEGKIFVLRPEIQCISKFETRHERLNAFYQHGHDVMSREIDRMLEFISK